MGYQRGGRQGEGGTGGLFLASAMGAGAGLFLAAAGTFGAEWLAGVLGAEGEILPLCASYLKIILQFSPFLSAITYLSPLCGAAEARGWPWEG